MVSIKAMSQIDTSRLEAIIAFLTVIIKIGKYLPCIVLAIVGLNIWLAIVDFSSGGVDIGIFNLVLAGAGSYFVYHLLERRDNHRYDYRYRARHLSRPRRSTRDSVTSRANVEAQ